MNPRVKEVYPLENYELRIVFANGEEKVFDIKPYLDLSVFKALNDKQLFKTVKPFLGSIIWANNVDVDPDTLYEDSRSIQYKKARFE